jgi:carboxypeptidase family protein
MKKWVGSLMVLGAFLPLVSSQAWGQATGSTISGLVRDSSQAVIAGATVTVTNTDTGISKVRQTVGSGRYRIGELNPGTYQVTVSMTGFSTVTRKEIQLQVGQELALNFDLQVGAMETQVDVTAEVPLVETTSAAVASVVTQEQLRELPLNGRSFTDLVTLQVAAVTPTNAANSLGYGSGPQLSVAGGRTDSNSYSIDGTDMGATANGTPGSAAGVQLGVDSIREYQVVTTNPKAESGRNSGAQINAVTRAGTNALHGSAFDFLRNSALDSRKFTDPAKIPPFRQNQFGATLGGPIRKDKTFYFLAYEGVQRRLAQTQVYNVPPLDQRNGTNLLTGTQRLDPRVTPFINLYPAPNLPEITGSGGIRIGQYSEAPSQPLGENYGSARVDHTFSSSDSLFGRFTIDRALQNDVLALQVRDSFYTQNMYLTLQEDHVIDPTKVNSFRLGYNRSTLDQRPQTTIGSEGLTFLPGTQIAVGSIGITNFDSVGDVGAYYFQVQNAFQFSDDLTYTRGAHTMKFGTAIERFRWNTDRPMNKNGTYTFPNLASFLTLSKVGTTAAISGSLLLPESSTYRHIRTTMLGFYAQDDYRMRPNLTLNYGLRWEFTTGLSETNDQISYLRKGWVNSGPNDFVTGELWTNSHQDLPASARFQLGCARHLEERPERRFWSVPQSSLAQCDGLVPGAAAVLLPGECG